MLIEGEMCLKDGFDDIENPGTEFDNQEEETKEINRLINLFLNKVRI